MSPVDDDLQRLGQGPRVCRALGIKGFRFATDCSKKSEVCLKERPNEFLHLLDSELEFGKVLRLHRSVLQCDSRARDVCAMKLDAARISDRYKARSSGCYASLAHSGDGESHGR